MCNAKASAVSICFLVECRGPKVSIKNVLVAGGGPASMEAGRVAAMRGHNVTLCDRGKELGGQLLATSVAPNKNVIKELLKYLSTEVYKTGVQVKLGKEVTARYIEARFHRFI